MFNDQATLYYQAEAPVPLLTRYHAGNIPEVQDHTQAYDWDYILSMPCDPNQIHDWDNIPSIPTLSSYLVDPTYLVAPMAGASYSIPNPQPP
ncbi:hypothetical protein BJV78DRAFT_1285817 [Lactifluus subvellereus]|nr:hypothetical protein BJV78DRAFT_1285817 [Lactifluus subvellereus]